MNLFGFLFTFTLAVWLLRIPRNWAPLPLLLGAVYITRTQQLEIGPLHFSAVRVLIVMGFLRATMNGERVSGGMNSLDRIVRLWAIWNICSLAFHKPDVFVYRVGLLYDTVGVYYLFRVFVRSLDDIRTVFKMVCLLLVPLAATMLVEKLKGINPLSLIEFAPGEVATTNGHFRAQGAFGHPILAGTVGAVCLPMAVCFWRDNRRLALVGLGATLAMVFASGSSGPVMATIAVFAALGLWKVRSRLSVVRWLGVFLVIVLSFLMNDPVYYLMARIDITGGSTGYFRAQLIQSAINHLAEWWFAGTDYTRHWMLTGIAANPNHTDMTNYYLDMGVAGGLPLMFLFICILTTAFIRIGKALRFGPNGRLDHQFLIWSLGCILFAHVTTFMSISYFDQTIVFLCLVLACIGSLRIGQRTPTPVSTDSNIGSVPAHTYVSF